MPRLTHKTHTNMQDKYKIDGTKIQLHPERLNQWIKDPANTFPIYIEISPVGHCNHRCTFCAVDYIGYKPRSLDTKRLIETLSNMKDCGVKSVMFAGEGEPLLHKDINQFIRHCHTIELDTAFTTNGVLLDKLDTDALNKTKWIKVSCNAGEPRTYAKIHKTKFDDFSKLWDNLRGAVRRKTKNTIIGVQAVLLPDNAESMENLVRLARDTGLDYCVIKPYSQHKKSETHKYENVRYTEYEELLSKLEGYNCSGFEVVARKKSMNEWDSQSHQYTKCYSTPYMWAYIMATGDVYGCSAYLLDERFNYGNINSQSFREIWTGERRKASMDYVDNELDIKECRLNCRMHKVNQFLWDLKQGNIPHQNFI